jgi:hypothetical protein
VTGPGSKIENSAVGTTTRARRRVRRAPILLVVVALLAAAVVAQRNAPDETSPFAALTAAVRAGEGIPGTDVVSNAWYCAAGTSSPDGQASERVIVANLAHDALEATLTVMPGGDAPSASRALRLAPGEQVEVPVADVLATPEPGVMVEAAGPIAVSHVVVHRSDLAVEPCTRTAATDWYFASGTTVDGAQLDLVLFNPFGDDAIVDVALTTDTGAQEPATLQAFVVPRRSRVTIPVQDSVLRQARVATHVHARAGRVVAEQMQLFDDAVVEGGAARNGVALTQGTLRPSLDARIVGASRRAGGDGTVSLANFADADAKVELQVVVAGEKPLEPVEVDVPAQGVAVSGVTTRVPLDAEYSIVVRALVAHGRRVPVVAELLASWPEASSATGVAGAIATGDVARRWVVPQPDVDGDRVLTVFNPGPEPVTAAMLPAGQVDRSQGATSEPEAAIPPGEARTFRLELLGTRREPAVVTADHPVMVGLAVVGADGASVGPGIPDFGYGS